MRPYDEIIKRDDYWSNKESLSEETVADLYKKIELLNERLYQTQVELYDFMIEIRQKLS